MSASSRRETVTQGQVSATADPSVELYTVLGSCIAICMYDPTARVGGMNHFLLSGEGQTTDESVRYGIHAFEKLVNELLKLGAGRFELKAKVFGGASMNGKFAALGPKNAEFALRILREEGIECIGMDLGGTKTRKLRFLPSSGNVQLMIVPPQEAAPVERIERAPRDTGAVELFS